MSLSCSAECLSMAAWLLSIHPRSGGRPAAQFRAVRKAEPGPEAGLQSCLLREGTGQSTVGPHGQRGTSIPLMICSLEIPEIGSQETKEGRERPGSRVSLRGGAVSNPSLYAGALHVVRPWRNHTTSHGCYSQVRRQTSAQHSTSGLPRALCVQWRA